MKCGHLDNQNALPVVPKDSTISVISLHIIGIKPSTSPSLFYQR